MVAERVNLRLFLTSGMILSGLFTALFGFGKVAGLHGIAYYIVIQVTREKVNSDITFLFMDFSSFLRVSSKLRAGLA